MTVDLVSAIFGAGLMVVGIAIGRFWPNRQKTQQNSGAVCDCGHSLAFHEKDNGPCSQLMLIPGTGSKDSHHKPCACKQYTGPRIIDPGYIAQELT